MVLRGGHMNNKTTRKSIIAPYIDGLLEEKHANGFSYESEELVLNRFDTYCVNKKLDTLEISKEFLTDWMKRSESEGAFNQGKRISCVKQLLIYMATYGINVYIPHDYCHFKRALPHIFEQDEIESFFKKVDSYYHADYKPSYLHRLANEYRLLFRWYLCLGLRNSEAAGILTENVDLENGILTILDSKGNKDRLVYLPSDLLESSRHYYSYLKDVLEEESKWFFPGINPDKCLPNTTVANVFNRFWNKTIYANCNNKPTVHDFRFSYVVSRMNTWAESNIDLQVMMPYLSKYLGHKSINETFYYYYLVKDAYNTVEKKDATANDVIPEVLPYE